jgi:hypothetical protein
MDKRLSVKFENALYEQTYKFGLDERLENFEEVRKLVDTVFAEEVLANFQQMHRIRMAAFSRAFPLENQSIFEEII